MIAVLLGGLAAVQSWRAADKADQALDRLNALAAAPAATPTPTPEPPAVADPPAEPSTAPETAPSAEGTVPTLDARGALDKLVGRLVEATAGVSVAHPARVAVDGPPAAWTTSSPTGRIPAQQCRYRTGPVPLTGPGSDPDPGACGAVGDRGDTAGGRREFGSSTAASHSGMETRITVR